MPLVIVSHKHYHQHHVHHHPGNTEQLQGMLTTLLDQLQTRIQEMIDPVVQALMDQAKKNSDYAASVDLAFKALGAQVATLQGQISAATAGSLTDAEKAAISATTSDLANSLSTLQADVSANTPAAAPPVDAPPAASPPADVPTTPPVDPNAPPAT